MRIDLWLGIAQLAVSALLVLLVLLQPQGVGLGQVFGGEGNIYRTKRGVERIVFNATIFLAVLFAGVSLVRILI
jgi:preprotein translocase subunit SecG